MAQIVQQYQFVMLVPKKDSNKFCHTLDKIGRESMRWFCCASTAYNKEYDGKVNCVLHFVKPYDKEEVDKCVETVRILYGHE